VVVNPDTHFNFYSMAALTSDGGVVAVGCRAESSVQCGDADGDAAGIVVRYSDTGSQQWIQKFSGDGASMFETVAIAGDGTIVAAGFSTPNGGFTGVSKGMYAAALAAIDPTDGTVKWAKTYGGRDRAGFASVAITGDTIIAVGNTSSTDGDLLDTHGGQGDAVVAAIALSDGTIKWTKSYGGSDIDQFNSVAVAADGTLVVAGFTYSDDGDFPDTHDRYGDAVIAAINPANGALEWAKSYGGGGYDQFNSVTIAPDNTIIVAAAGGSIDGDFPDTHGGKGDAVIAAINPTDGTIKWVKAYGGNDYDVFNSVAATPNGIIAVGWTASTDGDFPAVHGQADAVVANINPTDGTIEWVKTYGGAKYDIFTSVSVAPNGVIVIAGHTSSANGDFPAHSPSSGIVISLTANGNLH